MITFLKKYKAFIYGLLLFRIVVLVLTYFDLIHIDNSEYLSNTLSFMFYWLLFSLPIHFFSFLKKYKTKTIRHLVLIILFILVIINDANSKVIDNPITIIGIISIGLLFFSSIAPKFFKKHVLFILVFYTFSLGYFIYIRIYIGNINLYLQQEKEIKIILTTPFLILLFGWLFQQWKWLKTLESQKTKAELALLKSQINPHFFFNTLNNLYGLTVEKSDDAPNVVLKLSDMMRYTIHMGKKDLVPLKDEIEYLNNYIELHKIRYQKKVNIQFTHSNVLNYQIAPLLYIIAVENAFKHGVEKLTENAYIHIKIYTDNRNVFFEIENNFEKPNTEKKSGIGLDNLKQRLQLVYPKKHQLTIESHDSVFKLALKLDTI
ncbi:histidine kinase [Flavobacterium jejuense]|uniref:Histidine kinase n=1 Tax=Flavobacterium jejuense TaxID=1544455 RepID=A0ABX0ISD2_9FLAO|nr:histidine kinase [Flavobacterium jejuense]NHN26131.1 histidine kinase [Flavobacterium jejuense]